MQPNLFAGPIQRDDSYRILARLANGGAVPARSVGWRIDATLKARLAVTAGLLSLAALAWVWLPGAQAPLSPAPAAQAAQSPAAPSSPAPTPGKAIEASEPQAATIVSQVDAPEAPAPAVAREASAPASKPGTAAREPVKQAKRAAPPAAASARSAAPVESDEDVNLLAAMLKHAKPQKPPITPSPKN